MFTKTKNISFENPPFQYGATVLDRCKNKTKYQIDCNTPDGYMECYHLFPGIDLAYTTFKATSCFQRKKSLKNILEIAYCKAGRYECEYKRGFLTYLGEGDMSVSILEAQKEQLEFTTGFYDGVAIIVNQEITGNIFKSPISDLEIDFSKLLKRFCSGNGCCVLKTPPSLVHVMSNKVAKHGTLFVTALFAGLMMLAFGSGWFLIVELMIGILCEISMLGNDTYKNPIRNGIGYCLYWLLYAVGSVIPLYLFKEQYLNSLSKSYTQEGLKTLQYYGTPEMVGLIGIITVVLALLGFSLGIYFMNKHTKKAGLV